MKARFLCCEVGHPIVSGPSAPAVWEVVRKLQGELVAEGGAPSQARPPALFGPIFFLNYRAS